MRKFIKLFLALAMVVGLLAGCQSNNNSNDDTQKENEEVVVDETTNDENTNQQQEEQTEEEGKILVVYYSASSRTEAVAQTIATELDADLFELVPVEQYTSADLNYNDRNSRVSREHDDTSLRNIELVSTTVDDWGEYDTILIGYPIWWGIAAWPVNNFITNNDFTGKTVIAFCTSASSGLGESAELLEQMAGNGNWVNAHRFRQNESSDNVISWVNSLGLK